MKQFVKSLIPNRLLAGYRNLRQRQSLAAFQSREVHRCYSGVPLTLHFADGLGTAWYDNDCAELPEITFLRQHQLVSGARVFDLGAHQCVVAAVLAKIVGSDGSVIAVEANPHNSAIGRKNRDLNNLSQLTILEAAIADKAGTLVFNEGLNGQVDDGSGSWGRREVRAVTIDDLTREYGVPKVIFCDVEGFECAALRGASRSLRLEADWFIEVHVGVGLEKFGGSVEEVISFFPPSQFNVFMASDQRPVPHPFLQGSELTKSRFFLTAIHRANEQIPASHG